ncbi:glycoside hydrolase family 13 protein [Pseudoxanthomonas sacheonensis]|uniref:Glycosidase n=1 Tax=Pseudoxanthomonas sacheonensis TaxID=443615 RepID=A0ABU1RWV3_9GAMM|nr:glycoside hydrolase family 13 protein [Pseudoxanthomonas sacheonensis]MDR6843234.1 glycosidase [Pseudoxanthomonas sacheonensis]
MKTARMKVVIAFCFGLMLSASASARDFAIDHLEPASWWVGMKHSRVELMVHGNAIGPLQPRLSRPGVTVIDVQRVANPNYLFVTLEIAASASPGTFDIEFVDGDRVAARHPFRLDAREAGSAARKGFDASDAIYLITPDRFANGDPSNDSVAAMQERADRASPNGRHGGDIAGISAHLDYIAGMGFTQLWPTPLLENDQPKFSYHGYAITDLYRVDRRFGSNEDYRALSRSARAKGVGLIMDVVLNHIGSSHWWMRDLPTPDWINHGGKFAPTNHRRTTVQDPHAAPQDKADFVEGWFSPGMPDLNQRNPHLATYLIQNSLWWIEYAGLSGIREDTFGYADAEFLSAWGKAVLDEYPDFSMVGEEWSASPATVAHWQRGKVNADGHVPHMPSMMDFPVHTALRDALREAEGWDTGWIRLYEALANDYLYPDADRLVVFAENHDTTRMLANVKGDVALFKIAMAYLTTVRGTPQFFYGSEVLMEGPREREDGNIRADMPGGWAGDAKNAFTGAGLSPAERDAQDYLRRLLDWRRNTPVVQHGKLQHFAPVDGVYVYFRYDGQDTVMVALNRNAKPAPLALERFGRFIKAGSKGRDAMSGKAVALGTTLELAGDAATIISIE